MNVTSSKDMLRLEVKPLIANAEALLGGIQAELPTHTGLIQAATFIVQAAVNAERVTKRMRGVISLHRLPVAFLSLALIALISWAYVSFFRVATLTLALPDRDATELRAALQSAERVAVQVVEVPGSREASEKVAKGEVDLGFVQGGVPVPSTLRRAEIASRELVLLFLRPGVASLADARVVMTSTAGEGSHSVLLQVLAVEGLPAPSIVHTWSTLTGADDVPVPTDVDAVFVVKDPSDAKTQRGVERLARAGYTLNDVPLGARAQRLDYLTRQTLEAGWLSQRPLVPATPTSTWAVQTYLVAREGLTPRLLAQAARLIQPRSQSLVDAAVLPSTESTSAVLQGVDAFFGVLINIVLAFLALLGLDAMAYRRHFHELNSLVSLLSALQANKDVLAIKDSALRSENMRYLSVVSDLLGLISQISSFYTQENSALLFNNLSEVIHERCNGLKLNIQLKLLQSAIRE